MSELTATALEKAYTDGYLKGQKKAYDECDEVARELSQIKTGCSEWLAEHDKKIRVDAIDEFANWLVEQGILGNRCISDGEITDYGKIYAKKYKEQLKENKL